METHSPLLLPAAVLVAWTLVMWLWMYATRIPAIQRAKMRLDPDAPRGQQMAELPAPVRWKADNYNHLLEQPLLFYVLLWVLERVGADGPLVLVMAWSYVALRVIHSLVQALGNRIEVRFAVFVLSNLPLLVLTVVAITKLR
ncbi:MAPEG family protein [Ferrimonas kyonanensis]|uniref:MAPEG family protein n=1 Tax=Ferrimonas kyonanensis TaxID=364763 RepID=UPI0004075CAC|nr:MAPEG family protein [Ferrimonas kyonanensis]